MKLKEFDISEPGTGSVREGPTVGGGDPGVRGYRIQLPHSAGRENHGRGSYDGGATAARKDRNARDPILVCQKTGDFGVFEQLDGWMAAALPARGNR